MTSAKARQHQVIHSMWQAAIAAADPTRAVAEAIRLEPWLVAPLFDRILVVGGGKAGARMAQGVEEALAGVIDRIDGIVNVPEGTSAPLRRIGLHPARPAASNFPTQAGVDGVEQMLDLVASAGPNDLGICLISGGGSALLPAPAPGISLADKLETTRLLHHCGATIQEMNAVRKHLSRVKGGGLALAFQGHTLLSLVVSDVVGDPLDVIASGPTAPDSTTYADAIEVLRKYELWERVPAAVRSCLEDGAAGRRPETLKQPLPHVVHRIVANNSRSVRAAAQQAEAAGYGVLDFGAYIEGESREVAIVVAGIARSILREGRPVAPPCALILGGETTVRLGPNPGRGGRNVEFVLAFLDHFRERTERPWLVMSAGTDGEDGPTDAAGALADESVRIRAAAQGLNLRDFLDRHDAYTFFERCGGLWKTGLTGTNVMDLRVILLD